MNIQDKIISIIQEKISRIDNIIKSHDDQPVATETQKDYNENTSKPHEVDSSVRTTTKYYGGKKVTCRELPSEKSTTYTLYNDDIHNYLIEYEFSKFMIDLGNSDNSITNNTATVSYYKKYGTTETIVENNGIPSVNCKYNTKYDSRKIVFKYSNLSITVDEGPLFDEKGIYKGSYRSVCIDTGNNKQIKTTTLIDNNGKKDIIDENHFYRYDFSYKYTKVLNGNKCFELKQNDNGTVLTDFQDPLLGTREYKYDKSGKPLTSVFEFTPNENSKKIIYYRNIPEIIQPDSSELLDRFNYKVYQNQLKKSGLPIELRILLSHIKPTILLPTDIRQMDNIEGYFSTSRNNTSLEK